jgi:hypothetical protein
MPPAVAVSAPVLAGPPAPIPSSDPEPRSASSAPAIPADGVVGGPAEGARSPADAAAWRALSHPGSKAAPPAPARPRRRVRAHRDDPPPTVATADQAAVVPAAEPRSDTKTELKTDPPPRRVPSKEDPFEE